MQQTRFPGIFEEKIRGKRALFTESYAPGTNVYGESILKIKNKEYRQWDHTRSKLAAAMLKGVKEIGIKPEAKVLYLGAASGTTVSHVSDIVGKQGFVYALDFAYRVVRDLYFVSLNRDNIAPMFFDASFPESYASVVDKVDVLYMDIAQRNQVDIFMKNLTFYLKKRGVGFLCVKARSIDVSRNPRAIYAEVKKQLETQVKVLECAELEPYEKDHCVFIVKK